MPVKVRHFLYMKSYFRLLISLSNVELKFFACTECIKVRARFHEQ